MDLAAALESAVRAEGATVASAAGEGTESDDPNAVFVRRISDAKSEWERGIIRARTRAALAVKRARGERVGALPFGFRLAVDGKHIEPDPDEQDIIARVRSLRLSGLSQRSIAGVLRAEGVVSRAGRPLSQTQVCRVLRWWSRLDASEEREARAKAEAPRWETTQGAGAPPGDSARAEGGRRNRRAARVPRGDLLWRGEPSRRRQGRPEARSGRVGGRPESPIRATFREQEGLRDGFSEGRAEAAAVNAASIDFTKRAQSVERVLSGGAGTVWAQCSVGTSGGVSRATTGGRRRVTLMTRCAPHPARRGAVNERFSEGRRRRSSLKTPGTIASDDFS